jgi:hypothetical protein
MQYYQHLYLKNVKKVTRDYFKQYDITANDFINSICQSGAVSTAVNNTGLNPVEFAKIMDKDEKLTHAINAALQFCADLCVGRLFERGAQGYSENVIDADGTVKQTTQKYSDRCLLEYLKIIYKVIPPETQNVIIRTFDEEDYPHKNK